MKNIFKKRVKEKESSRFFNTKLKKKSMIMCIIGFILVLGLISFGMLDLNIIPNYSRLKGAVTCTEIPAKYRPYDATTNPDGLHDYGFDDLNFYSKVVSAIGSSTSLCSTVTESQLANIYRVNASNSSVSSIKGVQYLSELSELDVSNNNLSEINLSTNTKLSELYVFNNNLSEINLSTNTKLSELDVSNNNLSNIDLSTNTGLMTLDVSNNNLSEINLSANTNLYVLRLTNNNLSSLDLSHNTALTTLNANNNNLTTMDLSHNNKINNYNYSYLNLNNNPLKSISLNGMSKLVSFSYSTDKEQKLGSIDIDGCIALISLDLHGNKLNSINLVDKSKLSTLNLSDNNLNNINLSNNTLLSTLNLSNNNLSSIDLSTNTIISTLNLSNNNLSNINFGNDIEMINDRLTLNISNNSFKTLDLNGFPNLYRFSYTTDKEQKLESINLDGCSKLWYLDLSNNALKSINLSNNINLQYLHLKSNDLTSLHLSNNTKVHNSVIHHYYGGNGSDYFGNSLDLSDNRFKSLDLTMLPDLRKFSYSTTKAEKLESIDIDGCTALTDLDLHGNKLSSVNLADKPNLVLLNLSDNMFSSINLDINTKLEILDLSNNNLSDIDLSNNNIINKYNSNYTGDRLKLDNNALKSINLSGMSLLISFKYSTTKSQKLESINLSGCTSLQTLDLQDNDLSQLDMSDIDSIDGYKLKLNNNKLKYIKLSKGISNGEFIYSTTKDQKLDTIDATGSFGIGHLDLSNGGLKTMPEIINGTNLYSIDLSNNLIKTLDLRDYTNLRSITLNNNALEELKLKGLTNIRTLDVSNNKLSELYLNDSSNLEDLIISNNDIDKLDLSSQESFETLSLDNNPITNTSYLLKGKTLNYEVKFNQNFAVSGDIDTTIATYNNNAITGKSVGSTTLKLSNENITSFSPAYYELDNRFLALEEEYDNATTDAERESIEAQIDELCEYYEEHEEEMILPYFMSKEIKVYTVESDEYKVDTTNKVIDANKKTFSVSNVTLGLEGLTGTVEDGKYVIKDGNILVDTYTITNQKGTVEDTPTTDNKTPVVKADISKLVIAYQKALMLNLNDYVDTTALVSAMAKYPSVIDTSIEYQTKVDAVTKEINDAIAKLEYKDANYDKINELVKKIESIDKTRYTNITQVEEAMRKIVYGKKINEQSQVDTMYEELKKAYDELILKEGETYSNYLTSLKVKESDISFKKTTQEYTIKVKSNTSKLDLSAIAEDKESTVEIIGNSDIKNNSKVQVKVTSKDGKVRIYTLNVQKEMSVGVKVIISLLIILLVISVILTYLKLRNNDKK